MQPQRPDHELREVLEAVDRHHVEDSVHTLVGFGTRLEAAAARSGGRMTVALQTFVQAPGPRIPVPTSITNIIATLRGTTTPDRMYVVSAHIDSRVTDVLNPDV